ncbi:phage portal protein [Novipirellula rosea]
MNRAISRVKSAFTYDALTPKGRRKAVSRTITREDNHTRGSKHRALQANAGDLVRNMAVCAWAVRRHLDYVANFSFNTRTPRPEVNAQIERLMTEDSRPERFDVAGKFGREKMFRIAEARRVVDGDTLLVQMNDGRTQGIQADLIKDPADKQLDEEWINGVRVTGTGRAMEFGIHKREGYIGTVEHRRIKAANAIHYGFFGDRYAADQVRGVSPLTAALDPLRDLKDAITLAQARSKVAQLFAMAISRDAPEDHGDDDETEDPNYALDLNDPMLLNLQPGDKAEFLESRTPSTEFQAFSVLVIQLALKALDIPYSLFDGSASTFYGGRAEWLHYVAACKDKRCDQLEMRRQFTVWKLRQWIRDGRLVLPRGWMVGDIDFDWIPTSTNAWWDKGKETKGHVAAIGAGLDTPQRVCAELGMVYQDNIDAIAEAAEYAKSKGIVLPYATTTDA